MKKYVRWYFQGSYLLIYLGLAMVVTYAASPVHELNHAFACKINGLQPEIGHFRVNCDGIQFASTSGQFLFFTLPYIFNLLILILIWGFYRRHFLIKYFTSIPAIDILVNFINAFKKESDFLYLLQYACFNSIYFSLAQFVEAAIITATLMITFILIQKTRFLRLDSLLHDFPFLKKRIEKLWE